METKILDTVKIDLTKFSEFRKPKVIEWIENNKDIDDIYWKHIEVDGLDIFASYNGEIRILLSKQKAKLNNHGYLRYSIKGRTIGQHRLVAYAWGKLKTLEYNNNLDVDHINKDKTDNGIGNLRVISHKDNIIYRDMHGSARNKPIVATNIETHNNLYFDSIKEAAEKLKLKSSNICFCLKGKNKKTGNYIFEYQKPLIEFPEEFFSMDEDDIDDLL